MFQLKRRFIVHFEIDIDFQQMKFCLLNELTLAGRSNQVFTLFSLYGLQTMFGAEKSEFCLVVCGMH